jgi:hypothetical protein
MSVAFAGTNSDTEGPGDMARAVVAEDANAAGAGINELARPIAAATIASLVLIIVIALR